jgi:ribosome-associated heat shock protein Hsp15
MDDTRIDKLLWALRLYKTRPLATEACESGRVIVGQHAAKPGRKVRVGEIVSIKLEDLTRTVRIAALPPSRVGAKQVARFMEDLTPAAEYDRARQAAQERAAFRYRGAGRPTKKERRDIGRFLGWD